MQRNHFGRRAASCGILLALFCLVPLASEAASHALVIGVDHYECPAWRDLQYAKADASAMAETLAAQGFQVKALYDKQATRKGVYEAFDTLAGTMKQGDRFVFFFAGHGSSRPYGDDKWGFVVPADCGSPSSFLSMEELRDWAKRLSRAHQQLFILDSCFSGFFGLVRGVQLPHPPGRTYVTDLLRFPARQYITAGTADQQVLDVGGEGHSLFTGKLLKALKDGRADADGDGFVTYNELSVYLEGAAWSTGQKPTFGTLEGHEGGSFVFALNGAKLPPSASVPPPARQPARPPDRAPGIGTRNPDPIAYDPVRVTEGQTAALPGKLGNVSVTFGSQGEIDLATLVISPRQGKPARAAVLAAGSTSSFSHDGARYEATVMGIDWQKRAVTLSIRGPLAGDNP